MKKIIMRLSIGTLPFIFTVLFTVLFTASFTVLFTACASNTANDAGAETYTDTRAGADSTIEPAPEPAPDSTPEPVPDSTPEPTPAPAPAPEPTPATTPASSPETAAVIPADPPLKEAYRDYFPVGVGIERADIWDESIRDIILTHFETITCDNEMKPDFILDYDATVTDPANNTVPAIDCARADVLMDFTVENGLSMRGHTLIWHSQTPRWLFTEGFSKAGDAPLTDRATMLLRMENYIRQVMTHFNTQYPGVIFAWDVVNEGIEIDDGHPKGYRTALSLWYQTIGEDYMEHAFTFARQYAEPGTLLFYNDYNTYVPDRTDAMYALVSDLAEKGLLDGIGMQSHVTMDFPTTARYEETMRRFCALGLEVHVTELDVLTKKNDIISFSSQGRRYARIAQVVRRLRDEGLPVSGLTVWGVTDDGSWLYKNGESFPLLFDNDGNPKPAFFGLADPDGMVGSS